MYKNAHFWFGTGVCATICVLFGFTIPSIIVISLIGGVIAISPDWDQKISFIGHRGPTHSIIYILLITIPLSVVIAYIMHFINSAFGIMIFTIDMVDNGFPFPIMFENIARGNIISAFFDPIILIFIALFIGAFTHILLDIITPSGLTVFSRKLYGGILSEDAKTNKLFMLSGIFLFLVSLVISLASSFINTAYYVGVLIITIFIVISIVFFISVRRKYSRIMDKYVCYNINGNRFCTIKKGCIEIGGEKICPPSTTLPTDRR